MLQKIKLTTLALLFLATTQAGASVIFNPSFFYYVDNQDDGTKDEYTHQIINLKLGYLDPSGIYFGGTYDMDDRDYENPGSDRERKSIAGTVGYITGGWQFLASYYFDTTLEVGSTEYSGTGWAGEVGYVFNIGSLGLGPLLSYRNWEYDENQDGAITPKLKETNIIPSIQIYASF